MYEFHGWLAIYGSPFEVESEDDDRRAAVEILRDGLADMEGVPGLRDFRWVNGQGQFNFSGFTNHYNPSDMRVLDIVERVARRAPGTYGLVYISNDEDRNGREDRFQVLVVRRGEVHQETDRFLSPRTPMIEDGE